MTHLGHVSYPIARDNRYTITREFCGYAEPRLVLRFCGDWIMQSAFHGPLVMRAVGHSCERRGSPAIVEHRP